MTPTIVNLTPSRQARNANGVYPFEVEFKSRQQALRRETLKAFVVMGMNTYPMEPVPKVNGRWETVAPVPTGTDLINYHFKFEYKYNAIPEPKGDSAVSAPYELHLSDKP